MSEAIRATPDLTPVGVFVRVVEAGSFSLAAKQLDMPNSTVSAQVSRLERRLGVTLLHRTTRSLQLTEIGRSYFERVRDGVELLLSAESALSVSRATPRGLVRLTAASDILPPRLFACFLSEFRQAHPEISLEVDLSQRVIDLAHEGFDLAIRASSLIHNRVVTRRIGTIRWILVASEIYIRGAPPLGSPNDLKHHRLLEFYARKPGIWKLQNLAGEITIDLPAEMTVNHFEVIRYLLLAGQGIALVPSYYFASELAAGSIRRVLPEWSTAEEQIYGVFPEQQKLAAKTRALLDFTVEFFRQHAS